MNKMDTTPLRPVVPSRFRRRQPCCTVEALQGRIADLAAERQHLRGRSASDGALERNRVKLARAQWELSHALIARHLSPSVAKTAA